MEALNLNKLNFSYGNRQLFRDFDFSIYAGDCLLIKGDNGSGKTTLLSILAGVKTFSSGAINNTFKNVAYLEAEKNSHYLKLDAYANLKLWIPQLTCLLMQDILIDWEFPKYTLAQELAVERFSTGMKRKLALIRTIHSEATLWILDEPLNGLDQQSIEKFVRACEDHLKRNGAIVLSSHQPSYLKNIITSVVDINLEETRPR